MAAPPDVAAVEGGGVPGHDRLVPSVETEAAQQALLRDIDAILARLQVGIADERVKMDDLLRRIKAKASWGLALFWIYRRGYWTISRTVEDLLASQRRTREALAAIDERLDAIEDRITRIEAREGQVIAEAKAASAAAATMVASAVISDIVTRVTRIEMRHDDLQRRLAHGVKAPVTIPVTVPSSPS
jgi:hypothetical protein